MQYELILFKKNQLGLGSEKTWKVWDENSKYEVKASTIGLGFSLDVDGVNQLFNGYGFINRVTSLHRYSVKLRPEWNIEILECGDLFLVIDGKPIEPSGDYTQEDLDLAYKNAILQSESQNRIDIIIQLIAVVVVAISIFLFKKNC